MTTDKLSKTFPDTLPTTHDSKKRLTPVERLRAKKAAEEEKVKAIDEKIKQAEALEKKKEALKQRRLNEIERKQDTQRKIIIGGTIRAEAQRRLEKKDPGLHDEMVRLLDQWVVNTKDRELFADLIPPHHRKELAEIKQDEMKAAFLPEEKQKASA